MVIDWNPATEAMLGYTQAEAVGRELTDVMVPPEMHAAYRAALADVVERLDLQQQRVEIPALRKDGKRFAAEFTVAPFDLEGTRFFAVSMRDLTEVTAAR
ncbi:PAS domain-containing protein, partial [Deinococcus sp. 14RED07]|uniref:PAS domain-containing protein n=1 Tax=Deinococcus sp. 14RED07 TaxID=2745874 RepID=UPI001E29390D